MAPGSHTPSSLDFGVEGASVEPGHHLAESMAAGEAAQEVHASTQRASQESHASDASVQGSEHLTADESTQATSQGSSQGSEATAADEAAEPGQ